MVKGCVCLSVSSIHVNSTPLCKLLTSLWGNHCHNILYSPKPIAHVFWYICNFVCRNSNNAYMSADSKSFMVKLTGLISAPGFKGVGESMYCPLTLLKDFARASNSLQFLVMKSCEGKWYNILYAIIIWNILHIYDWLFYFPFHIIVHIIMIYIYIIYVWCFKVDGNSRKALLVHHHREWKTRSSATSTRRNCYLSLFTRQWVGTSWPQSRAEKLHTSKCNNYEMYIYVI